ncbi:unnamed protein product [Mytilus coruscus]|uniref:BIRC7_8 n=1 Tax=Mytilus coruscus TaxID=42192 RepID=A0A6J8D5H0_MYTCO|nr:unnamed protein product [Mytilus coruscus]
MGKSYIIRPKIATISNPFQRNHAYIYWPFDECDKSALADAGFVYTGKEEILKCETCEKTTRYHHWKGKKTPSQAHIDLNRHCEFAKDNSEVASLYNRLNGRLMYPYYEEYNHRLSSYSTWKFEDIQSSKSLADAGFFNTVGQDETICFSCGLWLADWQHDEKPWIVHVRYFPKCPYIKERKTLNFIRNVLDDWEKIYRPAHLYFEDETKRASTFKLSYRSNDCLSPDSLAEAGFFQDYKEEKTFVERKEICRLCPEKVYGQKREDKEYIWSCTIKDLLPCLNDRQRSKKQMQVRYVR